MSVSFRLYPQNGTKLSYMLGKEQLHLNLVSFISDDNFAEIIYDFLKKNSESMLYTVINKFPKSKFAGIGYKQPSKNPVSSTQTSEANPRI